MDYGVPICGHNCSIGSQILFWMWPAGSRDSEQITSWEEGNMYSSSDSSSEESREISSASDESASAEGLGDREGALPVGNEDNATTGPCGVHVP